MRARSIAVLILASFLLVSTSVPRATRAADPSTVVLSQGVDIDTESPIRTTITPTFNVLGMVYDYLVYFTPDGKPKPELALSWRRVSPTVVEYKLRPNVKFSNGDPFTSADVKFTIEKIKDPSYKSLQGTYVSEIQRVETPDPMTVRLIVTRASALLPLQRQQVYIVDSKFWQAHGDAYMENHAVGTGPYLLSNWKKDEEVDLDLNPGYWGKKPSIQHIIWRPIPDAATRVAALRTGETDLITNVPPQYAIQIEGSTKTRMASTRSNRQLFVAFNTLKPGPQDNKLVREACNYAIDVPAIVKSVLGGRGYPLNSPIPYGFFAFDPNFKGYHYDPAKAKELLAKAGFPEGKGLEITLNAPNGRYNRDKEIAEAVGGYFNQIGIKTTVNVSEWTNYANLINQRAETPLYELGWGGLPNFDPDGIFTPMFSSEGGLATWHTPETDKLLEDARYEFDKEKRVAMYRKAAAEISDAAPWIFLFQYEDLYGASRRLVWTPRPDERIMADELSLKP